MSACRKLCQIVFPWGTYEYLWLPMGIMGVPDIFQEQTSNLFHGIEFVRAYLDDLLVITKGTFEEHLKRLETILQRLQEVGLKVNAEKSVFGVKELEILGHWLTRHGIKPLANKIEAFHKLARPKNKREMLSFLSFVISITSVGTIREFLTPHQMSTQNSYISGSYMSQSSPKTNAKYLRQWKRVSG